MKKLMAATVACMCSGMAVFGADIAIVKPGGNKAGIDLAGMRADDTVAGLFKKTLERDLEQSGWFALAPQSGSIRVSGAARDRGGRLAVQCDVRGAKDNRSYLAKAYAEDSGRARRLAHVVADDIVFALKGVRGIASTRIAMVGARGGRKDLYACDADGGTMVQVTQDGVPCLAPAWGNDGNSIYYTSFVRGFPDVYKIALGSNRRAKISAFPGLNSGARVSPDGRSIVLTLSKDGNPDLYIMQLASGYLTRLTRTRYAAEASPCWSRDGRQIVFVSDRDGSPQLYLITAAGGAERRITFHGSQNVAPDWGPDGRIAYSSKRGNFQICATDAAGRESTPLTSDGNDHEDPSWAPDGRHIVYTKTSNWHSDVYILDTMGDPEIRLTRLDGNWYSPAWSPK